MIGCAKRPPWGMDIDTRNMTHERSAGLGYSGWRGDVVAFLRIRVGNS
jgi:hypothetical protein